ncbi:hypothetical protein P3T76_015936 [Phytophthora citrophthora]|uniref:Uncharacterized protein n=1 Tax=Phytophthora citrophthora TaxID=4793 RepID=A0AAD9FYZ1_9STRA|nr:hypothetical protein P3T76_015936 [Phytophthora citrophthora]
MKGTGDSNTGGKGMIYLCQKVRQHDSSGATNSTTCSQIWHDLWCKGTNIPPGLKTIRLRAPLGAAVHRLRAAASAEEDTRSDNSSGGESTARSSVSSESDGVETAVI